VIKNTNQLQALAKTGLIEIAENPFRVIAGYS
jgi:hypothetical protein